MQPYCYTAQPLLITLVWAPLFIARWCMNLSVVLSLISEKSPTTRTNFFTRPLFINSVFLLFLFAFLSTLIPLSIDTHNARNVQVVIFEKMKVGLTAASIAFDAGQSTALLEAQLRAQFADLGVAFVAYNAALRKCWIAWTTFAGFELLVFLISSSFYFSSLLASLRSVASKNTSSTGEVRILRELVWGLILSSAATLVVGGCHTAASVYLLVVEGKEDFATLLALYGLLSLRNRD